MVITTTKVLKRSIKIETPINARKRKEQTKEAATKNTSNSHITYARTVVDIPEEKPDLYGVRIKAGGNLSSWNTPNPDQN